MADNTVVDLLINRYLREGKENVRGLLHEQTPPALNTRDRSKALEKTTVGVEKQPDPPPISFVPMLERVGVTGVRAAAPKSTEWAKNIQELLTRIAAEDTEEFTKKYKNLKSQLLPARSIVAGCFYSFRYEAKTVNEYDRFPMIMALESDSTGFLGMNFHYLPLPMRFALFESMMPLIVPVPVIQRSRIYLTYQQLKRRQFIGKAVTIKRYNFAQLRSGVVFISPVEWPVALAYPSESFINTNRVQVWRKSQTYNRRKTP